MKREEAITIRERRENLIGQKFGRLTVIGFDHKDVRNKTYWLCECDCPEHNRVVVYSSNLKGGVSKSCGCLARERAVETNTKHGQSRTRLYHIWQHLIQRCENENVKDYYRYGGRGVSVCDEWHDFEAFRDWSLKNGYDDTLSIDREDVDSDYSPRNCRWVDQITQQNNKRNNRLITFNGTTHTLAEWSRIFNVNYQSLCGRINRGDMRDFESYFNTSEYI